MNGGNDMKCYVLLAQEELGFVATDAMTHIASQGTTPEEAVSNLKEALELYYEDVAAEDIPDSEFFATTMLELAI